MMHATRRSTLHTRCATRGLTLIELVIAIAIIGIAVSSVLGMMSAQATRSAEAMIREQATAIASAYLNEIVQKNFVNGAGSTRATFDGVDDYNAPAFSPVLDQWGNPVAGLSQFRVAVTVSPNALNGIPATQAKLINVTVSHSSGVSVLLSSYKTNHP
jgi:MSHA pilin protein MshD